MLPELVFELLIAEYEVHQRLLVQHEQAPDNNFKGFRLFTPLFKIYLNHHRKTVKS